MIKAAFNDMKAIFISKLDAERNSCNVTFGAQLCLVTKLGHLEK